MADINNILEEIKTLTVMELNDLVKALEAEFGVSAAAMAVAAPAEAGAAKEDEKTEFTVVLKSFGASKLNVIKAVRAITGLGLGDAKALVETADAVIKENVPKETAAEIEAQLKEAGAEVEIK